MTKTEQLKLFFQNRWAIFGVVVLGVAARMGFAVWGHNYDMDSDFVVAEIVRHGGNVYAETTRYNYGPVWFQIIHVLDWLAGHHQSVLRYLIAGLLTAVDAGIFLILCRQAGRLASVLFFLNPVSILITGFHSQFDNLAIALGLLAVLQMGDDFERPVDRRKFAGLLLLGLSLATKHMLFAFPLWLAVKQRGFLQKILIVLVPTVVFLAGFLPYWSGGHAGIIENVFRYRSADTALFHNFFVPGGIQYFFSSQAVWFTLLLIFALVCRRRNSFESLLLYTGVLVATSPATANQYLAIPVALTAVFASPLFFLYTAVGTYHLSVDVNGPHLLKYLHGHYENLAIYSLVCALLWLFWRRGIVQFVRKCWEEINHQFGRPQA
jgi:hypothetical protein